ncbi:hypothetical protein [Microvirga sp. Mcv34]|uniref:hypothetical protein n=1 Tax=Microvirga sp. Mcv34 TaxID=2926016 RepID=UPI0021C655E7|nr:hypothetical protein [Microvirga sp. Mcv34]
MKWFDPLIAAALAIPLGGVLYIDDSSLTLGQKLGWALVGMVIAIASAPTELIQDALLEKILLAFAVILGAIVLVRLLQSLRSRAK